MTGNRIRTTIFSVSAVTCAGFALTGCNSSTEPTDAMPSVIPTVVAGAPATSTDATAAPSSAQPPSDAEPGSGSAATTSSDSAPITPVDPTRYAAINNEVGWKSPSGNVYCKLGSTEFSSGCQATDAPVPDGADCDKPPFSADEMSKGFFLDPGRVTPMCFNQGAFGVDNAQPLEYNTSISFNGYTCYSRVEAMICDAGGGHGFVLSMQQATWN
ncbi:hypothetical protein CH254_10000 [Rhodococcus sp. 06-412-2C]|uniref:hypothetical protein n=1 Tax=unclassified Rhodococcus (in: high G+C Gram-positive bacteria) TaxID=192944 RepID=UPI000B9BA4F7|nr:MULTISPECIES: hypothetical protein [unclassified Rhodococcus (in: high G+C Gram-positive bacteria)]OZC89844.1 hypothetical protein CH254_10000 [Rhodococcus sp. 06-412-2C]OZC93308.1 hypothetical protein CH279_23965 [Rhodococcus sp. 06-412-2B]